MSSTATSTAGEPSRFIPGEPFDVRHAVCGFHPIDFIKACHELTSGQKLLLDLLFCLAAKTGNCYASASFLTERLGRSLPQIKRDLMAVQAFGIIRNERRGPRGRKASRWNFPFHTLYWPAVDRSQIDFAALPGWPFKVHRSAPLATSFKVSRMTPLEDSVKVSDSSFKVSFSSRNGITEEPQSLGSKNRKPKPRRLRASSSSKEANSVFEVSVAGKAGSTFTPEAASEPETANPLSLNVDDETAKPPKLEPARPLKASDQFKARLQERHHELIAAGRLDVEQVLCDVKEDLGNCPLSAFLQADSKTTTNPAGLRNPAGHYRVLARKTALRTASAPLQTTLRSVASLQADIEAELRRDQADEKGAALARYSCCSGKGKTPDGAYCGCACGDLLRQCDEHGRLESLAGGCEGSCTNGMTVDGEPCACAEGQKARRRMEATA